MVIAGGAVGIATVTAIATGTEIILTPAMIQLVIYKSLAAAALGLIVVGSWLGRRGRQRDQAAVEATARTPELGGGNPSLDQSVPRTADSGKDTLRSSRSG